ncbi:right-handed parallel beta-helix repeat-containing protein [Paenibacillus eucommiae]|uniref:Right handed beta helix domain-containing protein n=1 Tax=Paenibacillus eucommiae TaxID=1355755 RepID=A0ABS4IS56_9BACL|nr:right-handed parallel beta-helix repeat-containing protein [Paenibacillus eucommiae]MBP1990358.1 hypothetical protein [Paenibacillus eucommiae]
MLGKIKSIFDNANGQYAFPVTVAEAVYVDADTSLKNILDEWKSEMGETFRSYVLELKRWGVKNTSSDFSNKTDAVYNSIGINKALQWASTQGYAEVILPQGTYLIDEENSIVPQKFMSLNLNGSTLRIRNNGFQRYAIVKIANNQIYSRVTNGKIQGDRLTHDYSSGGTHEGGSGIDVFGGVRFISIDNLEIYDCTGDAITVSGTDGQVPLQPLNSSSLWEQGAVSLSDGSMILSPTKIRLKGTIDLSSALIAKNGYFGLYGDGYGGLGSDLTARYFDLIFYKNDKSFLSSINSADFYEEIMIPMGARYASIVLDQPQIPTNITITVRSIENPRNTYIEKCNLHHCRRQGLSLSGKWIYVRDNEIHHIGGNTQTDGTPPMGGIDIEDGYSGNQWIFIDKNYFHSCQNYTIVMKASRNIKITRNKIQGKFGASINSYNTLFSISVGSQQMLVSQNTFMHTAMSFYGETIASDNYFEGCVLNLATEDASRDKDVLIDNCYFYNSTVTLSRTTKYKIRIKGCSFINDSNKAYLGILQTISFNNEPQILSDCIFRGNDTNYVFSPFNNLKSGWIFNNVTFQDITRGVGLPSGSYVGCTFDNVGVITTHDGGSSLTDLTWEFRACKFNMNTDCIQVNAGRYVSLIDSLIVSQGNGFAIQLDSKNVECKIVNCSIRFPNSSNTAEFLQLKPTYMGIQMLLDNNEFSCSDTFKKKLINVFGSSVNTDLEILIRNNMLKNVDLTSNYAGKVTMINNSIDGVTDPYNYVTSITNNKYYKLYQKIYNSGFSSGSNEGWICTLAGYTNNTSWSASTSYTMGSRINYLGHVYQAQNAGTSGSSIPSFPIISGSTVIDSGSITWKEIGLVAAFKSFGTIQ